ERRSIRRIEHLAGKPLDELEAERLIGGADFGVCGRGGERAFVDADNRPEVDSFDHEVHECAVDGVVVDERIRVVPHPPAEARVGVGGTLTGSGMQSSSSRVKMNSL